jgi:D-aspartate ligase
MATATADWTGSFPSTRGIITLGRSVTNDVLLHQAETLLKAISYAGVMDIDYRFDERDRQYKLLVFNPRIGAQFRVFVDDNGLDVARSSAFRGFALWLDARCHCR